MLRVLTNHHNLAFSLDDLALVADLLDGWFNLHVIIPYLSVLVFCPYRFRIRNCSNPLLRGTVILLSR